jgi:hypothetical protein
VKGVKGKKSEKGAEMRKSNISIFVLFLFLACPIVAYADPFMPDLYSSMNKKGNEILAFLTASVSLLLEYLVVRRLLYPQAKLRYVLPSFVVINTITFPLTLFFGWCVSWAAELIPIFLEPIMYKNYFQKVGVEVPNLSIKIVSANLFSFLFGLLAYYYIFPYIEKTFYS